MEDLEKTFIDIDELAKKIEERILELEKESLVKENVVSEKYLNDNLANDIDDLTSLINEIDKRILELEVEEQEENIELDIKDLTEKVNLKLESLEEESFDDDLGKTLYDLNEISKIINETIKKIERQKEKKRKKAMYCDLARKKERALKNKNKRNKNNKKKSN